MGGGGAAVSAIVDYPRGAIVGPGRVVRYERPRFVPMMFANCVLWLNAARGVSTVDAAMPQPTRIDLWSTVFNGSRTATRYTEGAAGVTLYGVSEPAAALGTQQNHTYSVRAELPWLGDPNGRYCAFLGGGGAEQVYLDVQNQTISATAGNVNNAQFSGGVFTADCISTSGPNVYLLTWTGAGSYNHAGNGARFIECTSFTVEQKNASQWDDRSGNANHFAQGVGADRVGYYSNQYNGQPALRSGDVTDHLEHAASVSLGTQATIFLALKQGSSANNYITSDAAGSNGLISRFSGALLEWFNGGGADRYTLVSAPAGLNIYTIRQTNGVALQAWKNGVSVFGPVVPAAALTNIKSLFARPNATNGAAGQDITEAAVFVRSLTDAERKRVERMMGAHWGVAVL